MEQEVTMNNEEIVTESETDTSVVSTDTLVKGAIYLAGVATPFAVKGLIKLGAWIKNKIKEKKKEKLEVYDGDAEKEEFSEFDEK